MTDSELADLFAEGKLWIGGTIDPIPGITDQIIAALRSQPSSGQVLVPNTPETPVERLTEFAERLARHGFSPGISGDESLLREAATALSLAQAERIKELEKALETVKTQIV